MEEILQKITELHHLKLNEFKPLSGGDINDVYLLKCDSQDIVAKINFASRFPRMFEAEAKGLSLLKKSSCFIVPEVLTTGKHEQFSYLLMEYILSGDPSKGFWLSFAQNLVQLHKTTQAKFGLDHNNYIGSLPQQNKASDSATEFYITQRLEPQFRRASDKGFNFNSLDRFFKNLFDEIPSEAPALIHGDLWGGNYMISEEGQPVLIDPAVSFGPREMDIAMMHLFGGFDRTVYDYYDATFPLEDDWQNRLELWQLYYLLVHLNLFGSGYLSRVKSVIQKYS